MKVTHFSKQSIIEQNKTVMHFCRIQSNFHKMSAGFLHIKISHTKTVYGNRSLCTLLIESNLLLLKELLY